MLIYLKALPRIIFKKGLPVQLIYFVTSKCNSNCSHCFLQGELNKDNNILRLDEIEKIAKSISGLLSLSLTGGEPFLRDELPEIAKIFYKNGGFKNLTIISNGLETERIVGKAEEILSNCRNANVFIGLSLDGLEDTHNSIRGAKDAFTRTIGTFFGLKKLKSQYKNLFLGTCTTCSTVNQSELARLYTFLHNLRPDGIGINLIRGKDWKQYIDGIDIKKYEDFASNKLEDWKSGYLPHSNAQYSKLLYAKQKMQYRMIAQIYSERRYIARCYAGRVLAVMRQDGNVYPCEMIEQPMGNVRDYGCDFSRLWSGKTARLMRGEIKRSRCFCTYECATTPNILFNPRYIPLLIKEAFRGKL